MGFEVVKGGAGSVVFVCDEGAGGERVGGQGVDGVLVGAKT